MCDRVKIKIEEFSGGTAIVSTKGLYCVVFHGPNARKFDKEHKELLTAEGAIYYATFHNKYRFGDDEPWAEPISYADLRERYDNEDDQESRKASIERRVAERLEEIEAANAAKPHRFRQLLTRAAALIW